MPSKLFDPRPRDDVYPSADELKRAAPRAPDFNELDGPDDLDLDLDRLETSRAKMPQVTWPSADKDAPDYAHLEPLGREPVVGDKKFTLSGDDIERLLAANAFAPKGPDSRFVIAFRGANLIDTEDGDNDGAVDGVDHITLEETRPDHKSFRCVIGYYDPSSKKLAAFRASTVPNVKFMTNYYMWNNGLGGNPNSSANMLPTGCYVFRIGPHKNGTIKPALRLTDPVKLTDDGAAIVLRSKNDLSFKTDDVYDLAVTQDHVHCAYANDSFSSAGCLTIQGADGHPGPWSHFQAVLKRFKNDTRIDVVLLTGRDASVAAYLGQTGRAADSDYARRLLARLRPGSTSEAVGRLQQKLGMEPSGYFGPTTKQALVEYQRKNGLTADGIYTPALDEKTGWGIMQPPAVAAAPAVSAPPAAPGPVAQVSPAPAAPTTVAAAVEPVATPAPAPKPAAAPQPVPASQPAASSTPAAPVTAVATPSTSATAPAPQSAEAPAVIASIPGEQRGLPPRDRFTSVAPAAGSAEAALPPPARTVSPGLGAVAQRTSSPHSSIGPAVARSEPPQPVQPAPAARVPAPPAPPRSPPLSSSPPPPAGRPAVPQPPAPVRAATLSTATAPAGASHQLLITRDKLAQFAPNAARQYQDALLGGNDLLNRYAINLTPLRLSHFLAQIGNECGHFTALEESLEYRTAVRIREVWPSRFPTLAAAEPYIGEAQLLAEKVYGDRFENGQGDGWRYRGRGFVQITGRSNYRDMGLKLGIPLEQSPDLALDPRYVLAIACETWAAQQLPGERDLNKLADSNKLDALTYRINGGYTNIEDRRSTFEHAWETWMSGAAPRRVLDPDTLDRGDRGGRVDELNARLKDFGLFAGIADEPPQHVYTAATYRAVRILQAESGLTETGVTDPATWNALEQAVESGLLARGRGAAPEVAAAHDHRRHPIARRLRELRGWSIAVSVAALMFVVLHIFLLTHPTGNVVLWVPMLFAAAMFVAGLALWLSARPPPHWQVPTAKGTLRSAQRRKPSSFHTGEPEPVRHGINV